MIATLPEGETFTTSANVALIAQLRDTLSEIDGVESVASVVPELNPLTDQPLTPQAITGTPDDVIAEALNQNRVADLLVSQNGQHTLLIVTPGDDPISTASAVIDVARALKATVRTQVPVAAITGVIVVFSLWALPQLAVNPDQLFFFKDDDPVRLAFEKTEQLFGGATPLIGEFALDPQHPQQSAIDAIQATKDLEALPGVRTVFSVASLAGAMSPEQFGSVVSGDAALPMGKMVSEDGMRFILLPSGFTTEDLKQWTAYADESDTVTVLTGVPIVWDEIARLVLKAQAVSLGVAYLLVAGMLVVTYRKVRETLVSLVPITLTLATLLSFIAVSGVQLNLLTAVISSIVIGVGIDYAIHYVAASNNARDGTDGYVLRAIDKAGRPITANALGKAVALSALWISPLKTHLQVSQIMWVAMLTAAITTLIVIPALLPRDAVKDAS